MPTQRQPDQRVMTLAERRSETMRIEREVQGRIRRLVRRLLRKYPAHARVVAEYLSGEQQVLLHTVYMKGRQP